MGVAVVVLARTSEPPCFSVIPIPARQPALSAGSRSPKSYVEDARRGVTALAAGDLAGAKRALEAARAVSHPSLDDQADTLFLAGELALARRDAETAVAAFEGLLDVGPPSHDGYDVRVRLGLAEVHRGRLAAAEDHLRRAAAFDPTRVEPHALLAELYGTEQRADDQLAELEAAFRLDPQTDARWAPRCDYRPCDDLCHAGPATDGPTRQALVSGSPGSPGSTGARAAGFTELSPFRNRIGSAIGHAAGRAACSIAKER